MHKYTFNQNDPVNRHDPSGHESLTEEVTVAGLAPTVRGAVQQLLRTYVTCRIKSAAAAAVSGGVIGGIVGGGIDLLIQGLTGDGKIEWAQVIESALDGAKTGALEGALLAMSPTAFYCYEVEQALQQAVELKYTLLDPTVPTWQKYIAAVGFVTSALPLISPRLAKKMSDALQKFCFPAGTEVAVEDGNKPIEDIAVGDLVWAQSDQTGQVSLKRVKQLFVNVAASLVVITAGAETIEATDVHPFWVANQGWKAAGQVQVGDELWTRSGERVKVTEIGHKKGQFTVYNFEVEEAHTYFVGKRGLLSHNNSCYSGKLITVNKPDAAADALAAKLNGQARVHFELDPDKREFDAISDIFLGQAKPAGMKLGKNLGIRQKLLLKQRKKLVEKSTINLLVLQSKRCWINLMNTQQGME